MNVSAVLHSGTESQPPQSFALSDAAARSFRARTQRIDRFARVLISISGISVIAAVLGIGIFLLTELAPLFGGADVVQIQQLSTSVNGSGLVVLSDEHQEKFLTIDTEPWVRVQSLLPEKAPQKLELEGLSGQKLLSVYRQNQSSRVAFGTNQGKVWVGSIALNTVFVGSERTIQAAVEREVLLDIAEGEISKVAFRAAEDVELAISLVDGSNLVATRVAVKRPLVGPVKRTPSNGVIPMDAPQTVTGILIKEDCQEVLLGTSGGELQRWRVPSVGPPVLLECLRVVEEGGVNFMAFILGDRSVAIGSGNGEVQTWSPVRDPGSEDGWTYERVHSFKKHDTAIAQIVGSPRDKGFVTASTDGALKLHYMTTDATLAEWEMNSAPVALEFTPKADGLLALDSDGRMHQWRVDNPHPEISWKALFGKVRYEGYDEPKYVWQSHGATDDFEAKFSMVPLVFGTLKGTLYAMLFAAPIALFGALYSSQFLDKRLRNPVKSFVELMAALPSVVLGFVAGVILAPFCQGYVVSILILPVLLPIVVILGMTLLSNFSPVVLQALIRKSELWVMLGFLCVGCWLALVLGPLLERLVFGGDFQDWLLDLFGTRYDQRNALVVGMIMGFAVVPLIFTICEDAFSSVPQRLVSGSLACGASPWQTAWKVVLPAAGSGVFSAVMVGFGRAVGETMIVLMATGNTPIMDWSAFNGFRALSANIAVEIPEAPWGSTHYRVLFVAALLLFCMTFIVNTVAEMVRLRLRKRLQGM